MKSNLITKVQHDDDPKLKNINFETFELGKINVIVSIIAGQDYFSLPRKISAKLKQDLFKLTETAKTLFITSGLLIVNLYRAFFNKKYVFIIFLKESMIG